MEQTGTLRSFFELLESKSAIASDAEALVGLYAPGFLYAGPDGTQVVKATDLSVEIPKRKQLFDSIGRRSTTRLSLHETRLDDRYTMVRTEWQWQFDRGSDLPAEITLPSTFIGERSRDGPKIVFYLAHADIMTVLRARGPLTASRVRKASHAGGPARE
jgi:hypothetical protein